MIAFDSSALFKLIIDEAESAALHAWVSDRPDTPWVASELCRVELVRAVMRADPEAVPEVHALLAGFDVQTMSYRVLSAAAVLPPPTLRALDALHLASALVSADALDAFVVYDDRLADAARSRGLPVIAPA